MTDEPLTPQSVRRDFGARAVVTREAVRVLHEALGGVSPAVLARWRGLFGKWAGRAVEKVPRHLAKLANRYDLSPSTPGSDRLLFALQTYYALLVSVVAGRFLGNDGDELLPDNPFSWCLAAPSAAIGRLTDRLVEALACRPILASAVAEGDCDLFKSLYEDLFPRALRHQLGEYYTPDWLAAHVLDQVGYTGEPGTRLLDPACGSGTFLVMAIRRLRKQGSEEKGTGIGPARRPNVASPSLSSLLSPLSPVVGFDLNPLAVMTARANYLIAMADLLPKAGRVEVPVYLCDSILGTGVPQTCRAEFDYVVGNPPWIAWDNLPDEDRQATKPLWERYGLFSLSGRDARHGGGKKDLSMLMLYAAADSYLKPGGRLGMVITQTLFQTKGAGDGFRRFRLGADGLPLKVLRVDDLVALRPFGNAANWTSTIVLEKGAATQYPVPYYVWGKDKEERRERRAERREEPQDPRGAFIAGRSPRSPLLTPLSLCWAGPIDAARPNSPWLILPDGEDSKCRIPADAADYVAHLGANSGGANGVYWVEIVGAAGGGVRVRNIPARGKQRVETIEHVIEPDLLYPLLRWSDVRRYSAVPRGHLLLAQDPATRTGIGEDVMRERYPRTWAYLERFRGLLASPGGIPPLSAARSVLFDVQRRAVHDGAGEGRVAAHGSADQRGRDRRMRRPAARSPADDSARDVRTRGVRFDRRGPLPLRGSQQCHRQRVGAGLQRCRRQEFRHAGHVGLHPGPPLPALQWATPRTGRIEPDSPRRGHGRHSGEQGVETPTADRPPGRRGSVLTCRPGCREI